MFQRFGSKRRRLVAAAVVSAAVVAVSCGVALAAGVSIALPFSGDGNTINGCYSSGGALKVLTPSAPTCPNGYVPIHWNVTGPQGIQGIQGIPGVKGDKGDQGIQGVKGDKGDKGDQGIQGIQGIPGVKGDKGDPGIQGIQGQQGAPGPTSLDALNGSPCTFNSHPSTTQVTVDPTSGAVSIVCNPVYKVSLTITSGSMTLVDLRDQTTGDNNDFIPASGTVSVFIPKGHKVLIEAESGTHLDGGGTPFNLFCPNGDIAGVTGQPGFNGGTYYSGQCGATVDSDLTSTATFR